MKDAYHETRMLRQQLAMLNVEAAKNEAKLKGFQAMELELLTTNSLAQLLDCLVGGVANFFALDAVTLVLRDADHEIRHLLLNSGVQPESCRGVLFVDELDSLAPIYGKIWRPWLGPYLGTDYHCVFPEHEGLRSVALLPLFRDSALVGSLNFGSADSNRYTRYHAADFLRHLAVIASVSLENALNRERLLHMGFTDLLTGCHNRRYLEQRLAEEIATAQRYQRSLSCLFLDLDHFKQVNDTYGHQAGDQVLRVVATRLKGEVRACDVAARYGGEEFAVLLPHTNVDQAFCQAERIRLAMAATPIALQNGLELWVTVSIGIAEAQAPVDVPPQTLGEHLLHEADTALYRAKAAGRNCVVCSKATAPSVSRPVNV